MWSIFFRVKATSLITSTEQLPGVYCASYQQMWSIQENMIWRSLFIRFNFVCSCKASETFSLSRKTNRTISNMTFSRLSQLSEEFDIHALAVKFEASLKIRQDWTTHKHRRSNQISTLNSTRIRLWHYGWLSVMTIVIWYASLQNV
jgi:hypothetical protein